MSLSGFVASATIEPSRFVSVSGAGTVATTGANGEPIGISHQGSCTAPIEPSNITAHATAGLPCGIYGDGEECLLEAGAAFAVGAFLKSDASGRGVTAATTERYYALAKRAAAAAGEKIPVVIMRGIKQ